MSKYDPSIPDLEGIASQPNSDVDDALLDAVYDGLIRIENRGFQRDECTVFVGVETWNRLGGKALEVAGHDSCVNVYGALVFKDTRLPDDRALIIADEALRTICYDTDSAKSGDAVNAVFGESSVESVMPSDRSLKIEGEVVQRPDAIEFVPEAEGYTDE